MNIKHVSFVSSAVRLGRLVFLAGICTTELGGSGS